MEGYNNNYNYTFNYNAQYSYPYSNQSSYSNKSSYSNQSPYPNQNSYSNQSSYLNSNQYSNQNQYSNSIQYSNQNQYSNIDPYSSPYSYQYPYQLPQHIPATNPITRPVSSPASGQVKRPVPQQVSGQGKRPVPPQSSALRKRPVPPPSSGKGKGPVPPSGKGKGPAPAPGKGKGPVPAPAPAPSSVPDSKSISLRIMSFNIHQGGKRDGSLDVQGHEWGAVRKIPCINMFKDINPDIAMLQECRREQLNDIKANLPFYTYYSYAKDGVLSKGFKDGDAHNDASFKNAGQRNVIMLRTGMFEVLQWGKFWLSDTPHMASKGFETNGTKITLWLKVRHIISGKEFHIFNSHFLPRSYGKTAEKKVDVISHCSEVSVAQMKAILGFDNGPVFFGGDLNCGSSDSRMKLLNQYMQNANSNAITKDNAKTYNAFSENSSRWTKIDHLYYKNAFPKTFKVVNAPIYGTKFLSDHFPIYCDFEIV